MPCRPTLALALPEATSQGEATVSSRFCAIGVLGSSPSSQLTNFLGRQHPLLLVGDSPCCVGCHEDLKLCLAYEFVFICVWTGHLDKPTRMRATLRQGFSAAAQAETTECLPGRWPMAEPSKSMNTADQGRGGRRGVLHALFLALSRSNWDPLLFERENEGARSHPLSPRPRAVYRTAHLETPGRRGQVTVHSHAAQRVSAPRGQAGTESQTHGPEPLSWPGQGACISPHPSRAWAQGHKPSSHKDTEPGGESQLCIGNI